MTILSPAATDYQTTSIVDASEFILIRKERTARVAIMKLMEDAGFKGEANRSDVEAAFLAAVENPSALTTEVRLADDIHIRIPEDTYMYLDSHMKALMYAVKKETEARVGLNITEIDIDVTLATILADRKRLSELLVPHITVA